jgi:hypothetical protein
MRSEARGMVERGVDPRAALSDVAAKKIVGDSLMHLDTLLKYPVVSGNSAEGVVGEVRRIPPEQMLAVLTKAEQAVETAKRLGASPEFIADAERKIELARSAGMGRSIEKHIEHKYGPKEADWVFGNTREGFVDEMQRQVPMTATVSDKIRMHDALRHWGPQVEMIEVKERAGVPLSKEDRELMAIARARIDQTKKSIPGALRRTIDWVTSGPSAQEAGERSRAKETAQFSDYNKKTRKQELARKVVEALRNYDEGRAKELLDVAENEDLFGPVVSYIKNTNAYSRHFDHLKQAYESDLNK